ncbi:RICIN domain-containing protein [Saccharothrix coeruleofusca]|uniref:Ricin B lectin domain-containing protein n=1 Tax=Saccharothrix coeruleofusca TaxID=33919 RepID=A0A918AHV8_9PSEU|nr:RICIN domain-containing protein [Saccharothrix coeruleofusca]MBP2340556.1 hypothetical protein [Saccharothrix coeruleofusca]GGP34643.1 hypothetical protein GCM10010185_01640 [Saccharothrix coeruleofusca]
MKFFNVLAGVALVFVAIFAAPGAASAGPADVRTPNSPIYSLYDSRCLDVDVATPTHNGTKVQLWDCNGRDNQKWTYLADHTIRSTHDGRCLDADVATPTHNGTKVQVWDCNGRSNQKWTIYDDGRILSHYDARCLDLDVATPTHSGSKVQMWECNGWTNQGWRH